MSVVDVRCPACGEDNAPQARFCSSCGAKLDVSGALREERKLISVLFVDLVGFTTRSDGADPEDVRDALQLYHADAKKRIEQYGGTLEKFIGDAVMAVFGAPVAHGDDAERAVRAGLNVLEGIGDLNRDHGLELAARAAVNTGEAVVSMGFSRGEALAMGDVVNTASRLQEAAPTGRVIVGAETHRATRQSIRYEATEPVSAKGKAEPVEAWLAVEPSTAPAERPLATREIVGRDRELELLGSLWARASSERRPHLVTIVGPPGIGKSRLCREGAALMAADGGRTFRGRCLPYGEPAGYQSFSFLVRDACGILASDSAQLAREKLDRTVRETMPETEAPETARYLALLLGLAPDDTIREVRLLFFAARRFLECLGLEQPTVLIFEDIHWAQSSEIELLEYLAQHLRDSPLLLIALARPELLDAQPTWGGGLAARTMIPLDPLEAAEAAALAARIVRESTERSFDVDRLVEVAGGNPLFLEELAASVSEVGDDADLPVTVREAIAARIDAMPPEVRAALLSAAVVGRTFWRSVLESVGGIGEVDEALLVLESRDLVRRDPSSQLSGDAQFTFKHMLIREVAYSIVPRAARRDRHAAVARSIEEVHGASADTTLASILAYHWSESDEPARAIHYLLLGADKARRSWAKGAAIDLYAKALELARDDGQRREIRLERGRTLVELGDYPRAAEELGELLDDLEGAQKLEALIHLGFATVWTENEAETIRIAGQALALAEELGDESAVVAALAMESQGLAMRGGEGDVDRALEVGDCALERWVEGTRRYELANHLHLHADLTYWVGEFERSVALSRKTRATARDVHSAESLLRGGGLEALALAGLGRHEEAIAIWDEFLVTALELGRNPAVVLNYSALAYRELHDLDEARQRSERALDLMAGETFGMPTQFASSDLLFTQLLAGDVGGAQAAWPSLWDSAGHATGWTTWLIAGRLATARAEIALHAETPETAREWAQRAVEVAQRTRRRKYEALSLTLFGEALAQLGRRDEALAALRAAVGLTDDLIGQPGRWRAREALGRVSYLLGEDDAATVAYAEAGDLIESFAATLAPARSARFLATPAASQILSLAGRIPVA